MKQNKIANPLLNSPTYSNMKLFMIAVAGVVILLFLYLVPTFIFPMLGGDGLGGYSAVERQAAERALAFAREPYRDHVSRYVLHVDAVRPTTDEEAKQFCESRNDGVSSDPNNQRHYTVKVTIYELFTPRKTSGFYDGCNFFPQDPGPRDGFPR